MLEAEPWMIESLELRENELEIRGWAFPPLSRPSEARFTINDQSFDIVEYPVERPGMDQVFWQRQNALHSGFRCRSRTSTDLFPNGALTLRFDYPDRPARYWFHNTWFFKDPKREGTLPEANRRYRVVGTDSPDMFCIGGFSDFSRMNLLLKSIFGKSYDDFPRILDWGCGCGRVARYFDSIPGISFHGGDIDPDNVSWCAANLEFGSFQTLPLHPPTPFRSQSFDLIYGISVFTHLRESVQFSWLEELQRISAPGAVLLMTVHGPTALNYAGVPEGPFQRVQQRIQQEGFVITSSNDQVNEFVADHDYYVNVMHSRDYIRENWSNYFIVRDIIPGFIHTHDMVLLQNGPRG